MRRRCGTNGEPVGAGGDVVGVPGGRVAGSLRASCEAQGVPIVVVRDAQEVADVAVLLGVSLSQDGAGAGARVRVSARPPSTGLGSGSETPDGPYPGRIEAASAGRLCDDDMIENR